MDYGRTDHERIAARVAHGRRLERIVVALGWFVALLGVIAIGGAIFLWVTGQIKGDQAGGVIIGAMMATIVSGSALFVNGVNVGLGAERLELAAKAEARAQAMAPAGQGSGNPA